MAVIPEIIAFETNNSVQLDIKETKMTEGVENNLLKLDNNEQNNISTPKSLYVEDIDEVENSDKLELLGKEIDKFNVSAQFSDIAMVIGEPDQHVPLVEQSTPAITAQVNGMEPTQVQMISIDQKRLMEESQQQVIPITKSILNYDVKLNSNEVDQYSIMNIKDSEFNDIIIKEELPTFSTEDSSQNLESPLQDIKPNFIKDEELMNIENFKNVASETFKIIQDEEKKSKNDITDALSTLATTALNETPAIDKVMENVMPIMQVKNERSSEPVWCDVGVIKSTNYSIKQYFSTFHTDEHENTNLDHLPDYTNKLKIDVQPGTAYKLRIAAINACGRGEWSEVSVFKTCLPGYPGAPSSIKIIKSSDGAHLSWEAPPMSSGKILEYSVCLAIKNPAELPPQSSKPHTSNLYFVRVYCGSCNATVISHESLEAALIDTTSKPAIIFRIAARNEKGYGPATQVRWLQDSNGSGSNKNPTKRESIVNLLTGFPKKPKI